MLGGDDVRQKGLPEDRVAVLQVCLPEGVALSRHRLFARDAVDQHIQPVMLAIDPGEQRLDLRFDCVIDPHSDGGAAGSRDQVRGLVDGLGSGVRRRMAAYAAAGAIHGGAGFTKRTGDSASGAARGAGDNSDMSCE